MTMQPKQMLKQMIDFNKANFDNAFNNMAMLQGQMESIINTFVDQSTGMTEQSKKAAKEWAGIYKKGFEDFKRSVDDNFNKVDSFFQQGK
jgi:polyhydroxyalkanoate synthesis regulator protein